MTFPLSLATFRGRFPEFQDVGDTLAQAALDEAEEEIDEDVWGDKAEHGHGQLAAHLLTERGYGREVSKDGTTTYGRRYERLVRIVGGSYRVILD